MSLWARLLFTHCFMFSAGICLAVMAMQPWKGVRMGPKRKLPLPPPKADRKWGPIIAAGLAVAQMIAGVVLIIAGHEVHGALLLGTGSMTGFAAKQPALIVLLIPLLGCGASPRTVALNSSLATLSATSAAFNALDQAHQEKIVAPAREVCTKAPKSTECHAAVAQSRQRLLAYHQFQGKVVAAVVTAYGLIAVAALDDKAPYQKAVAAVAEVVRLVQYIRGAQ